MADGMRTVPRRRARHGFGDTLVDRYGFRGQVDAIYADYDAAVSTGIVPSEWFDMQEIPPSTRDQVFYSLVGPGGAVLVGELDARRQEEEWRPPDGAVRNGRR